ncbi:hypothetical protein VNO78_33293 [Psophocarpus tetragonolobus]|uniref:Uncharacterized protein n=1 Tax=Psophocarpus tetragonolobus TaxID=3891 RepID=A0AAN9NWR1_PSOTE
MPIFLLIPIPAHKIPKSPFIKANPKPLPNHLIQQRRVTLRNVSFSPICRHGSQLRGAVKVVFRGGCGVVEKIRGSGVMFLLCGGDVCASRWWLFFAAAEIVGRSDCCEKKLCVAVKIVLGWGCAAVNAVLCGGGVLFRVCGGDVLASR